MELMDILLISLMIEAVVEAVKPLWKADGTHMSIAEMVSIAIGVLVAVTCRINMMTYFVELQPPVWMEYVFYVMTGIALGRGPSFVHDLWSRIKEWSAGAVETAVLATQGEQYAQEGDPVIEHWSLGQLRSFCALNGVPCENCHTREEYMQAMKNWIVSADEVQLMDAETPACGEEETLPQEAVEPGGVG